jgi:protein phosphatase
MTPKEIRFLAQSDRGLVRANNEDNFLVQEETGLFAVCDGLGGHAAGEIASQIAVDTLDTRLQLLEGDPPEQLREVIAEANRRILQDQHLNPEHLGMGTTLSALWIPSPEASRGWVGHIGDSRIYRFRNKQLDQLTEDHSPLFRLYKQGTIDKEALRHHPQKNLIERSLGLSLAVNSDIFSVSFQPGDRLLLCTDGLTDYVSDEQIARILSKSPWDQLSQQLVEHALAAGGFDNISVIIVEFSHRGTPSQLPTLP